MPFSNYIKPRLVFLGDELAQSTIAGNATPLFLYLVIAINPFTLPSDILY